MASCLSLRVISLCRFLRNNFIVDCYYPHKSVIAKTVARPTMRCSRREGRAKSNWQDGRCNQTLVNCDHVYLHTNYCFQHSYIPAFTKHGTHTHTHINCPQSQSGSQLELSFRSYVRMYMVTSAKLCLYGYQHCTWTMYIIRSLAPTDTKTFNTHNLCP